MSGFRDPSSYQATPEEVAAMNDRTKVWPSGLTLPEAEELHRNIIEGTRIFGAFAIVAHLLAFIWSPWLH